MSGRLILVRHGQSHGNVERRLDTRPPGADLTDLGRDQARAFARERGRAPGLLIHSIARRAAQTAAEIGGRTAAWRPRSSRASTRCRPASWRTATTTTRSRSSTRSTNAGIKASSTWPMPGGESARDVLDRYLPVITDLRLRYLDDHEWTEDVVVVSHGAAIRLTAATLAGVESSFVLDHHLANTESVVLAPITDGRWSCVQWGVEDSAVLPRARRASGRGRTASPPTRWADVGQTAIRSPVC